MTNTRTTAGMALAEERVGRPIGEYLVDAYEVRELSQQAIADEIGADVSTVSRWMRRLGIRARSIGHKKTRALR
jgi:transposase